MRPTKSRSGFTRFAKATSRGAGRPVAFILAVGVILAWLVTGPDSRGVCAPRRTGASRNERGGA